jgi:hypothetical protein
MHGHIEPLVRGAPALPWLRAAAADIEAQRGWVRRAEADIEVARALAPEPGSTAPAATIRASVPEAAWHQSRQLRVTFDAEGRIVEAIDGTARQ